MRLNRYFAMSMLLSSTALTACASNSDQGFEYDSDSREQLGTETAALVQQAIPGKIEAETFARYSDTTQAHSGNCGSGPVDMGFTGDEGGGCNIGWIAAGEWLEYDADVQAAGSYAIEFRVATPSTGTRLRVEVDGRNVTGSVALPVTGSWDTFTTVTTAPIPLVKGQSKIRVTFETGNYNLNWLRFVATASSPAPTVPAPTVPAPTVPAPPATVPPPPAASSCSASARDYMSGNGSVTHYSFAQGPTSELNCGFPVAGSNPDRVTGISTGAGSYFAAMNTADYATAATCGACVEVTRDNRKVIATIVDQCPSDSNSKCVAGHLDLSTEAFKQIGSLNEGYVGTGNGGGYGPVSWRYVPCPVTGNVSFRLHDPSNQWWNEVLVEGHRHAIESVEVLVDGTWVQATRTEYNYWQPPSGRMGTAPYRIRATDVNGHQIEASIQLNANAQNSGQQFPSCQ